MIFNSFQFLLFFLVVFFLYYFPLKGKTKAQNLLLLLASYVFYGIADWRMIPLLLATTGVFYVLGILIGKYNESNEKRASILTVIGVCSGIGLLLYFKYLNFFITSFSDLFATIGLPVNVHTFTIIMPLGISFFTFKLISYVIEVHKENIQPERDLIAFALYTAFFPTIMSGPIDRPNPFLPQLHAKRLFNYELAVDGCKQILWGLFKKMVIADSISAFVDLSWNNISAETGSGLLLVALLYPIQLYADFSGYSDIAIGIGKTLGFRITKNFSYPFFQRNIAEFWKNWHISLTSWLTDYVFTPLNFSFRKMKKRGVIYALIINFILVGLWHGANWTFVVVGLYYGLLYIPLILSGAMFKESKVETCSYGLPQIKTFYQMLCTYFLVALGDIFFRAKDISQAYEFISSIFSSSLFSIPSGGIAVLIAVLFILFEWIGRKEEYPLKRIKSKLPFRVLVYWVMIFLIFWFGSHEQQFIYTQF